MFLAIVDLSFSAYIPEFLSDRDLLSIDNPSDIPVWNNMAAIKSNILKRWDSAPIGVRVCCIKFVQKVVQMQTPGANADPRVRHFPY